MTKRGDSNAAMKEETLLSLLFSSAPGAFLIRKNKYCAVKNLRK